MKCLRCNGNLRVIDSSKYENNVYRRRKCDKCGFTIHTKEIRIKDNIGRSRLGMGKKRKGR